ncbi:MAG: zinc ribbon domain-containing protein [Clostridia bacterium]|jgi:hypothetical protein
MICQNCGNQILSDSNFCTACGHLKNPQEETGNGQQNQSQVPPPPQFQTQPQYQTPPQQPLQEPMQQPMQQQTMYPQKKQRSPVPFIIIIVLLVALAGVLVYGYMQSTPEAGANRYFTAILHKNGDVALENVYIPKDITAEKKSTFKKEVSEIDWSTYDINSLKIYATAPSGYKGTTDKTITIDGKSTTDFKVMYTGIKVNNEMSYSATPMVKQGKIFFIFDKWVVKAYF